MTTASDQLRSLIDRILRLKQEQDDLAADIREIYAEAKSSGYDKTRLGEVVAYIRKREKKGEAELAEADSIFSLYLSAYDRTASHAHAREARVSVSALPIVTAAPDLAAEESVGTDTSLAPTAPVPEATEPRADSARTSPARGDHSDNDEGIPTWLQRGHPDCDVREQGRG